MALDKKRMAPDRSWMSVAHQLGYFDQMHMIRDFRASAEALQARYFSRAAITSRGH